MKTEIALKLITVAMKHLAKNSMEAQMQIYVEPLTKRSEKKGKEEIVLIPQAELIQKLSLSDTTLWRHRVDGMPYKKLGGKIFYDYDKVVKWMEGSRLW